MIKLVSILLFTVLLLSVSSATYVKKASAISFTTGPCPSGEARDYMGICFPKNECKSGLFAAPGTCREPTPQCAGKDPHKCGLTQLNNGPVAKPKCTTVNGVTHCTIAEPQMSPIPGKNLFEAAKNLFTKGKLTTR